MSCKEVTLAGKYDYMEDHLFASLALIKHDFFSVNRKSSINVRKQISKKPCKNVKEL